MGYVSCWVIWYPRCFCSSNFKYPGGDMVGTLMGMNFAPGKVRLLPKLPLATKLSSLSTRCSTLQQQGQEQDYGGILCEPCSGKGWLLCDFCNGQKANVKAANNRIYRRCPSCKAIGYILCSKCKVYKCVTFPNEIDGEVMTF